MESVGAYIKRERELRGFTLDEVAHVTRISLRFLAALEADDYKSLPAEPFVKGFLRSYAQCIGLNPDEVMLVYEETTGSGGTPEEKVSEKLPETEPEKPRVAKKLIIGGAVLVVCIVVLVIIAMQMMDNEAGDKAVETGKEAGGTGSVVISSAQESGIKGGSGEQVGEVSPPHPPRQLQDRDLPKKLTILPMRSSPQARWSGAQGKVSDSSREATYPGRKPVEELTLKVHAIAGTWVEIKIVELDMDERIFLPRGDTRVWTAKEQILLTLGNVKGVELNLNDQKITVPDTEGNVLRNYPITRDTLR